MYQDSLKSKDNGFNLSEDESIYKYTPDFARIYKRLREFDVKNDVDGFGDEILQEISRTGMICYPWELIKPIVAHKIEKVVGKYKLKKLQHSDQLTLKSLIKEQSEQCLQDKLELYEKLLAFENPPWTIQRICELLLQNPETQHHTREGLLFALQRLINVKSTLNILTPQQYDQHTKANEITIKQYKEETAIGEPKPLPSYPNYSVVMPRIYQKSNITEIIVNVVLYIVTFFTAILLWNSITPD